MSNLLLLAFSFSVAAGLYRFGRPIIVALRRFDAKNRVRRRQEFEERFDGSAHYRHTLALADEQFEQVQAISIADERTGMPVTRFLFLGDSFAAREEAEAARHDAVIGRARAFYQDLDRTYLSRARSDPTIRTAED